LGFFHPEFAEVTIVTIVETVCVSVYTCVCVCVCVCVSVS